MYPPSVNARLNWQLLFFFFFFFFFIFFQKKFFLKKALIIFIIQHEQTLDKISTSIHGVVELWVRHHKISF